MPNKGGGLCLRHIILGTVRDSVAASTPGLIVGQGSINVFAAGVFLKPVAQELGFGRGDISTAIGLSSIVTALMVPFFGRLVDVFGVRPMLLWSITLFALATAGALASQRINGRALPAVRNLRRNSSGADPDRLLQSDHRMVRPAARPRPRHCAGRGWAKEPH